MPPALPQFYMAEPSGLLFFLILIVLFFGGSFLYKHFQHEQAKAANAGLSPSNPHTLFGSDEFEVKITRHQRQGFLGMVFYLDFKTYVPPAQLELIRKYDLYNQVLYESSSVDHYAQKASDSFKKMPDIGETIMGLGSTKNLGKTLARDAASIAVASQALGYKALSNLAFRLTVHDFIVGKTITSKDHDELIAAETVVLDAAKAFKELIERAETFTGNEQVKHI